MVIFLVHTKLRSLQIPASHAPLLIPCEMFERRECFPGSDTEAITSFTIIQGTQPLVVFLVTGPDPKTYLFLAKYYQNVSLLDLEIWSATAISFFSLKAMGCLTSMTRCKRPSFENWPKTMECFRQWIDLNPQCAFCTNVHIILSIFLRLNLWIKQILLPRLLHHLDASTNQVATPTPWTRHSVCPAIDRSRRSRVDTRVFLPVKIQSARRRDWSNTVSGH